MTTQPSGDAFSCASYPLVLGLSLYSRTVALAIILDGPGAAGELIAAFDGCGVVGRTADAVGPGILILFAC
jgi:hypothetical protein